MIVLDYRTQTLREVTEKDLMYIDPLTIVKVAIDDDKNNTYRYTYSDGKRLLDWEFTMIEMYSGGWNFYEERDLFLSENSMLDANLVDKVLFFNNATALELKQRSGFFENE